FDRVRIELDGAPLGDAQASGADPAARRNAPNVVPVYVGPLAAGNHSLRVYFRLRGDGEDAYAYRKGYRFEVRSAHTFPLAGGRNVTLRILSYEKDGEYTERPAVAYVEYRQPR